MGFDFYFFPSSEFNAYGYLKQIKVILSGAKR